MKMCDCGHDIYGDNRPFHITSNQEDDRIIVISNENPPGHVDLNSVLIDEYFFGGVEKFINKEIFDIQVFNNFCFLCENIILKDRIILSYDIFNSEFTNQLRNEGILAKTLWPEKATSELFENTKEIMNVLGNDTIDFHILMKLGVSKFMGISYSPPIQELNHTDNLLNRLNERILNSILMDAYSQLSSVLERDINLLKNKGRKIDYYIPPIPAILLDNISRPEEIGEELLNMREKFKKARDNFREYMDKIQNDNLSLKQSLDASISLERQLKELTKPYDKRDITSVVHWDDLIDIIPDKLKEINLENLGAKEILKIIGLPIKFIINRLKMKNVVHLFRLKKDFYHISNYNDLVKKVFGKSFDVST